MNERRDQSYANHTQDSYLPGMSGMHDGVPREVHSTKSYRWPQESNLPHSSHLPARHYTPTYMLEKQEGSGQYRRSYDRQHMENDFGRQYQDTYRIERYDSYSPPTSLSLPQSCPITTYMERSAGRRQLSLNNFCMNLLQLNGRSKW